jgi:beta-galactosidase
LIGGAGAAIAGCTSQQSSEATVARLPGDEVYSLNNGWLFGGEFVTGSEYQEFDDRGFEPVTLPHTVVPLSWHDWDPTTWQRVWIYRRHFDSGGLPARSRIIAEFDGVMVNATVVLNDHVIASHQGGYLPWTAELTGHMSDDDNVLAVVVDSRSLAVPPIAPGLGADSIDFLQPGGIYRDVRMLVVPRAYLADVFVLPHDVLTSPWLEVECTVDAAERLTDPATLTVALRDGDTTLAEAETTVVITRPGKYKVGLNLTGLTGITHWSPDNPRLYTVEVILTSAAGTHARTERTGFREAAFTTDGFFLNGERLKIFGLDRHQLYPYTGMAMPARVQQRDAEILKYEFNCNMVRCSHYPQSPHFLDACDELGIMVWQEAPGWHYVGDQTWQDLVVQNVHDMVYRDRGRPSVIIWGTRLNETDNHPILYRRTRQMARELDGSRPSSGAMDNHSAKNWDEDVFAYDDYNNPGNQVRLLPPVPGVPYLVTESVGVLYVHPRHFRWTDPPHWLADQAVMHAQAHAQAAADDRYCGLLGWCAFDYGSAMAPGTDHLKTPGVADTFRVPKPGAAIYQSQADPRKNPVIIPVFTWDFHSEQPPDGPQPNLMIATNCDHVEVSGPSLLAAHGPDAAYAHLSYPPVFATLSGTSSGPIGELRITGFLGGQQVTEVRMSSDAASFRLALAADDDEIIADGSDATRVVFRAVDAYGNQVRYRHGDVTLKLTGPGTLVGDSVFPFGAYGGLGAAWVRSRYDREGTITLTATHPELGPAQVSIRAAKSDSVPISPA